MGAFYVLESSRSKEKSGTGLGLAIVKSILERHGFEYGVSSIDGEIQFYINVKRTNENISPFARD